MQKDSRIYIAGHTGLFGSATVEYLKKMGYSNLLLKTHQELDLTIQSQVESFFQKEKPEYVFSMAGLVGGIQSNNSRMAEFTMEKRENGYSSH